MLQSLVISVVATAVLWIVGVGLANMRSRGGAMGTVATDAEKVLRGGLRIFQILVGICLVLVGIFSFFVGNSSDGGAWSWLVGAGLIALGVWQIRGSNWIIF